MMSKIGSLMKDRSFSIADALEILQSAILYRTFDMQIVFSKNVSKLYFPLAILASPQNKCSSQTDMI